MKKKKILIAVVMILSVVCGNLGRIYTYADYDPVKSRGNFVLDNGKMAIYASDMDYLQAEMDTLYDELPSIIGGDASGTGAIRRSGIQSKGILDYGNGTVVLDSSDFTFLADEIDELELEYKSNTVAALNDISTYFKLDGSTTHNQEEENLSSQYAAGLSFDAICEGIRQSQSVDHLANVQAKDSNDNLLYYADENAGKNKDLTMTTTNANGYPILIQPATANNLTAGTAAWVDGELIIGNGADNNAYYNQGYEYGKQDTTIIKKLLSLMYNHSEHEETFALNDATGKGYTTSASSTGSTKSGTEITLRSDRIPLYDLTDEEHPKLLYKVTYQFKGSSNVPNQASADMGGSIDLCDENGNIITSTAQSRIPNDSPDTIRTGEFILTNYNTSTDYVYLNITAKASATANDASSCSTSKTYLPTMTCIYYSDPE